MRTIAFKPYPCGTMVHPYIDCALRLRARGLAAERIASILCETAEGFVHRLWEPIAAKHRPPMAMRRNSAFPMRCRRFRSRRGGFVSLRRRCRVRSAVRTLSAKVGYVIDPDHPYPAAIRGMSG